MEQNVFRYQFKYISSIYIVWLGLMHKRLVFESTYCFKKFDHQDEPIWFIISTQHVEIA